MSARYAVYYAPAQETPIWRMASAWLGRDAYGPPPPPRPVLEELAGLDLDALTADPRGYGFHATLKAPFELAADASEAGLLALAADFATGQSPFEAVVSPAAPGPFLAFRLAHPCPAMADLHAACVRNFEPLRAPLSALDMARRRKSPLTTEQDRRLETWGYPYVFEDFRFHMTLTNAIGEDEARGRVLRALTAHFAPVSGPHRFDGVAIFRQVDRQAPFEVLERFGFGQSASAGAVSA